MATVGFGDVYRYGGRFVGYLFVVTAVAGVFLGGGAYLTSEVMTLTDPSIDALSQTQAFVGVILMGVGALLGLIGFFGLAHKLLTESMELALAAHEEDGVLTVEDAAAESSEVGDSDEGTSAESEPTPEPERAGAPAATPDHGQVDSEPPTQQPTPPEPAAAESSAGESPADEPEPVDAGPGPADQPPVSGEPAPGSAVDDGPVDAPEPADVGGPTDAADPADTVEDSPPEWTPPDPSEFDKPDEEPVDDGGDDAVEDSEPVADEEPVADADTVIDTEPAGEPEPTGADEPEPTGADEPEPANTDEIPDDATLADEGVEGFQAGSEDDPLADRLPSEDE